MKSVDRLLLERHLFWREGEVGVSVNGVDEVVLRVPLHLVRIGPGLDLSPLQVWSVSWLLREVVRVACFEEARKAIRVDIMELG